MSSSGWRRRRLVSTAGVRRALPRSQPGHEDGLDHASGIELAPLGRTGTASLRCLGPVRRDRQPRRGRVLSGRPCRLPDAVARRTVAAPESVARKAGPVAARAPWTSLGSRSRRDRRLAEQMTGVDAASPARSVAASGMQRTLPLAGPVRQPAPASLTQARARSFRIRSAASLPGAPITQPPGCVPEPHW